MEVSDKRPGELDLVLRRVDGGIKRIHCVIQEGKPLKATKETRINPYRRIKNSGATMMLSQGKFFIMNKFDRYCVQGISSSSDLIKSTQGALLYGPAFTSAALTLLNSGK